MPLDNTQTTDSRKPLHHGFNGCTPGVLENIPFSSAHLSTNCITLAPVGQVAAFAGAGACPGSKVNVWNLPSLGRIRSLVPSVPTMASA